MTEHPEDRVIAGIDALIDAQLRAGPHDDYRQNYYPNCPQCGCDWHGIACKDCGCPSSEGEVAKTVYVNQIERARLSRGAEGSRVVFDEQLGCYTPAEPSAPWVIYHPPERERRDINFSIATPCGYTLSDIEAMRQRSWVLPDYPQRYILGDEPYAPGRSYRPPQIRFWARNLETNQMCMVEGTAQVLRINWNRNGASVALRLDPVRRLDIDDEDPQPEAAPAGTVPEGMIAMEGGTPDGFVPIGTLRPEDLDIEYNADAVYGWGGDTVRCVQERYEATIRVDAGVADPLMRQLGAENQTWEIEG